MAGVTRVNGLGVTVGTLYPQCKRLFGNCTKCSHAPHKLEQKMMQWKKRQNDMKEINLMYFPKDGRRRYVFDGW